MSEATSQATPAISYGKLTASLDLEKAIDECRQTVIPLIDPSQEKDWDGVKLKSKEAAILQACLQLLAIALPLGSASSLQAWFTSWY